MVPSRLTTSIRLPSCSIPFIDPGGSSEREHTLTKVPRRLTTGTCSAAQTDRTRHSPSQALPRIPVIVQGLEGFVLPSPDTSPRSSTVSRLLLFEEVCVARQDAGTRSWSFSVLRSGIGPET